MCWRVCVRKSVRGKESDIMIWLQEVQFALFSKWLNCVVDMDRTVCGFVWILESVGSSQFLSEILIDVI